MIKVNPLLYSNTSTVSFTSKKAHKDNSIKSKISSALKSMNNKAQNAFTDSRYTYPLDVRFQNEDSLVKVGEVKLTLRKVKNKRIPDYQKLRKLVLKVQQGNSHKYDSVLLKMGKKEEILTFLQDEQAVQEVIDLIKKVKP